MKGDVLDDDGTPKDPNGLAYMNPDEWRELVNRAEREADMALNDAPVAGVLGSDVERKPVRWIWKGRLARGEMTILDGDPGLGKSTMLCDLAARITTGRPLPGEEKPPRDGAGGVVLVTTEDSPSPTVRPRLDAAGADVGRVRIVPTVPTRGDDGGERVPKLPEDLDVLKATCRDVNADLLVIDPLLAHLSGEINTFKDGDVRSALAPVQTFAEEAELALVVVRHLTKASAGANPLYRGQASIGIIGAARLALACWEPENTPRAEVIFEQAAGAGLWANDLLLSTFCP